MLIDFQIKNFRCFKDTKFDGFQRVNLIGGKNNSGKTALLEAIFLYISPKPESILFLTKIRQEMLSLMSHFPEKAWNNLFFNQDKKRVIEIIANYQINQNNESFNFDQIVNIINKDNVKTDFKVNDFDLKSLDDNFDNLLKHISSQLIISSQAENDHFKHEQKYTLIIDSLSEIKIIPELKNSHISFKNLSPKLAIPKEKEHFYYLSLPEEDRKKYDIITENFLEKTPIFCLSSFTKISHQELAKNFDLAFLNDKSDDILNILQKLDPSIAEIRTLTINEPDIYLKRKGENFLPISLFGDCFNRVLDIILKLINTKNSVCLIDEIENGIHYQNQREFWRSLFKLAVELDIQIFATTHSLEMIQAFNDVGLNSYADEGAYFEVARNEKTNQIVGIKTDLELLQYSLKHEEGVGLRGE